MRTMSGDPCLHYDCMNRNSFGYCKTATCINPKYSNIGTAQYGQGVQKRIVTNADRIRSMSDEELGKFMKGCPPNREQWQGCMSLNSCSSCWLDWLKQEAE